jgi:hypothetical protein
LTTIFSVKNRTPRLLIEDKHGVSEICQGDTKMGKRTRKSHRTQTTRLGAMATERSAVTRGRGRSRELQELVIVATADTAEEAKDYETLLKNNDIPTMIKRQQDEFTESKRFVVMTPEDMADEAHVIIESQDAYDDFYDFGLEDENEDEPDGDIFEEEF